VQVLRTFGLFELRRLSEWRACWCTKDALSELVSLPSGSFTSGAFPKKLASPEGSASPARGKASSLPSGRASSWASFRKGVLRFLRFLRKAGNLRLEEERRLRKAQQL